MERWKNKVAVVTGASAGIGAAIVNDLIQEGVRVVALARREQILKKNQDALPSHLRSLYYPVKCDITNESDVIKTFEWIQQNLGGLDILINNAGVVEVGIGLTTANNSQTIRNVVETNLMAVVYCTREAFNLMKKNKVDGHIVILNSIAGHKTPNASRSLLNIYPATKHAVTAMTETYRQEFFNSETKIKMTSISPGAVETEIIPNVDEFKKMFPILQSKDISNAILYVLSTPPHVQIHEMIIKPVGENF